MTTRGAGTGYWLGFALVVGGLALVPLGLPEFWRRHRSHTPGVPSPQS